MVNLFSDLVEVLGVAYVVTLDLSFLTIFSYRGYCWPNFEVG